jgi:hypothetical protein
MRGGLGLALLFSAATVYGQDVAWRPSPPPGAITLGRPQPAAAEVPAEAHAIQRVTLFTPVPTARGQAGDIPPPPPYPGAPPVPGGPPGFSVAPFADQTPYNCGVVNSNVDQGGFWGRLCGHFRRCWDGTTDAVGGIIQPVQGRSAFQSDHCFDYLSSPVTNPFYFEDPRALTQVRPVFIWQHTPNSNYIFNGGNNYYAGVQGSVAFTPYLSLTVDKLGWTWLNPNNPQLGVSGGNGFSEIHLGPKFTFLRNQQTGTVMAAGLIFEAPVGSASVLQNTGSLSLTPYLAVAQTFGKTAWGSFNFMNTTGYSFPVDDQRTEFFYSSFHLDYNVRNANIIYPFVELNWVHYTVNGGARDIGFDAGTFANFGSNGVAGHNELTTALGFRYAYSQAIQFGLAGEFNVLGSQGGRHLDAFRLTADMIFRY